jgi:hypothetical protein
MPMQSTSSTHGRVHHYKQKIPNGLTWAIEWMVIETLKHCCWQTMQKGTSLFDALFVTLAIMGTMRKEYTHWVNFVPPL